MANWLIRQDAPSVSVTRGIKPEVRIRAQRRPRIRANDQIFFLSSIHGKILERATVGADPEKTEAPIKAGTEEHARASIPSKAPPEWFGIPIRSWEKLPEPLEIDALRYSLGIVRNLERPAGHFRRGYRSLPKDDVLTITSGEAYVSRTAFYELYFALPPRLRAKFDFEEQMSGESGLDDKNRLRRLDGFLAKTIYAAGDMLEDISTSIAKLEFSEHTHAFATVGSDGIPLSPPDSIEVQTERFRRLHQEMGRRPSIEKDSANLIERILDEVSSGALATSEARFAQRFRRRA